MNLITFFRIVYKNLRWLIIFPVFAAALVVILTRDMPKEYASSTSIYTGAASGYDLTSGAASKLDYLSVNNTFDNMIVTIKSREAVEESVLRLLSRHLVLKNPDPQVLGKERFDNLQMLLPDTLRKNCRDLGSRELCYVYLNVLAKSSTENIVTDLLKGNHPYYGVKGFNQSMTVTRKQNSDMLEMVFRSNDPAVSRDALQIMSDVFISRYRNLKGNETSTVAGYFENQLQQSKTALSEAEDRLKNFMVENRIINYYEQSRYVAETRENIAIEMNQEKMELEAAKSALYALETKLEGKGEIIKNNGNLMKLRDQISATRVQLSRAEIFGADPVLADSLRKKVNRLEKEYRDKAILFYSNNYTIEASPQVDLLRSWLDKSLAVEEFNGRLKIFAERKAEFDKQFDEYAPWGSTIQRLEREVEVAEQQYLSVLHGLNQAKLQKQNLEYSSNLTVVDPPFLPLQHEKSKRMLLVILTFAGTMFSIIAFLVATEILDHSIKTPARAMKQTGLPMLGALPYVNKNEKTIDLPLVQKAMMEQAVTNLLLELNGGTQHLVITFSNLNNEGKTWVNTKLQDYFDANNRATLMILPTSSYTKNRVDIKGDYFAYPNDIQLIDLESLEDFGIKTADLNQYKLILLELPNLSQNPLPIKLIKQADLCMHVINSGRVWTESDENLSHIFAKTEPRKQMLMLNAVTADSLEELMGTIPKKRSAFRQKLHRLVHFGFQPSKLKSL